MTGKKEKLPLPVVGEGKAAPDSAWMQRCRVPGCGRLVSVLRFKLCGRHYAQARRNPAWAEAVLK